MEKVMCCALAALGLSFGLGGFLKWEHSYGVTPGPGSWGQWDIHGGLLVPLESCPGHAWSRAGENSSNRQWHMEKWNRRKWFSPMNVGWG